MIHIYDSTCLQCVYTILFVLLITARTLRRHQAFVWPAIKISVSLHSLWVYTLCPRVSLSANQYPAIHVQRQRRQSTPSFRTLNPRYSEFKKSIEFVSSYAFKSHLLFVYKINDAVNLRVCSSNAQVENSVSIGHEFLILLEGKC